MQLDLLVSVLGVLVSLVRILPGRAALSFRAGPFGVRVWWKR